MRRALNVRAPRERASCWIKRQYIQRGKIGVLDLWQDIKKNSAMLLGVCSIRFVQKKKTEYTFGEYLLAEVDRKIYSQVAYIVYHI